MHLSRYLSVSPITPKDAILIESYDNADYQKVAFNPSPENPYSDE
jgi:hypothetical protein